MSCAFKCREDKGNQIYWKQDHKQTQMITEYDRMVHVCVSGVLQGEGENQARCRKINLARGRLISGGPQVSD